LNGSELSPQADPDVGPLLELFDGIQPKLNRTAVQERTKNPLAQEARPHGRHGTIEHAQKSAGLLPRGLGITNSSDQLKIVDRRRVKVHRILLAAGFETCDMAECGGRLALAQVAKHGSGRLDADGERPAPESVERLNLEVVQQQPLRFLESGP
jgi:hypothetical protein